LELLVYSANVGVDSQAPDGARWCPPADLANEALPNLMRKVLAHAIDETKRAPASTARRRGVASR
jgi:A/G-specific adenine glycosylase